MQTLTLVQGFVPFIMFSYMRGGILATMASVEMWSFNVGFCAIALGVILFPSLFVVVEAFKVLVLALLTSSFMNLEKLYGLLALVRLPLSLWLIFQWFGHWDVIIKFLQDLHTWLWF
jgi:hypothetical protein